MTVMPFGRFVGKSLPEIPHPYLRWAVLNTDLDYRYPGLKLEIVNIIRGSAGRSSKAPTSRGSRMPGAGSQYPRLAPNTRLPPPSDASSGELAGPTNRVQSDAVHIKVAGAS